MSVNAAWQVLHLESNEHNCLIKEMNVISSSYCLLLPVFNGVDNCIQGLLMDTCQHQHLEDFALDSARPIFAFLPVSLNTTMLFVFASSPEAGMAGIFNERTLSWIQHLRGCWHLSFVGIAVLVGSSGEKSQPYLKAGQCRFSYAGKLLLLI